MWLTWKCDVGQARRGWSCRQDVSADRGTFSPRPECGVEGRAGPSVGGCRSWCERSGAEGRQIGSRHRSGVCILGGVVALWEVWSGGFHDRMCALHTRSGCSVQDTPLLPRGPRMEAGRPIRRLRLGGCCRQPRGRPWPLAQSNSGCVGGLKQQDVCRLEVMGCQEASRGRR